MVDVRLAVGESQSAFALTTFVNVVHPLVPVFDGFLIHSRGGAAMPLGEPGVAVDPRHYRGSAPTPIRDDLDVPVVMVETETDLLGSLDYLPARQPDSAYVRLWEVAGTAHADKLQIGEFEELLGCPRPVNRGQQAYVVRAALRWLDGWARGGDPAPTADRLEVDGERVRARRGRQHPRRRAHAGRRRAGRGAARRHRAGRVVPVPAVRLAPCRWTRR